MPQGQINDAINSLEEAISIYGKDRAMRGVARQLDAVVNELQQIESRLARQEGTTPPSRSRTGDFQSARQAKSEQGTQMPMRG